ncbi:MAG: hypothetical protein AB7E36_07250, partial [Salinivirgaceae bacterium]
MKNIKILTILTSLFTLSSINIFAADYSETSTACTGSFTLSAPSSEQVEITSPIVTQALGNNDTYTLTVTSTNASSIEFTVTLGTLETNDSLIITNGTDTLFNGTQTGTLTSLNGTIIIIYKNLAVQKSSFVIDWQGLFSSDGAATNITCFGDENGTAQLFPTGGTPGYIYSWTPAAATRKIENLTPGSYSVTATDANGCIFDTSFTITQPSQLTASINQTKISCFGADDGEALVSPLGGSGSYTYLWDNGKGTAASAVGLDPTVNYTVTITDANHNSCSITKNIAVAENPDITATIDQTKISCFGANDGEALVSPLGGSGSFTYLWDNGKGTAATAVGLNPAINYNVTITDANHNSCSITKNITVAENPNITATIDQTKISCFGMNDGQATVSPSGGTGSFAYNWSEGKGTAATATGLSPAVNYTVTVTDNGQPSCSISKTIAVAQNPEITATINQTKISCFGADDGEALAVPAGGSGSFTFLWDNLDVTNNASSLTPALHNVTITDATHSSCSITKNITITENPQLTATVDQTKISCFGADDGEALVSPLGGSGSYTYLWDNGKGTSASAVGLDPTVNYTVTITDANHTSCSITKNITVAENPDITATIDQTKISCFGANDGEALVSPLGGSGSFTYLWDNGKGTAASAVGLDPTVNYTVTITDANHNSCSITKNITVAENPNITATIDQTKISCFGMNDGQ